MGFKLGCPWHYSLLYEVCQQEPILIKELEEEDFLRPLQATGRPSGIIPGRASGIVPLEVIDGQDLVTLPAVYSLMHQHLLQIPHNNQTPAQVERLQ